MTATPATPHQSTDPRTVVARAVATARDVIAAVGPEHLALSTPCREYDVAALLGHTLGVFERLAAIGRGDDPMAVNAEPPFAPVADWTAAFSDACRAIEAAWADPAALERVTQLPWATLPGSAFCAMYTSEITVHTWDLATATGQRPQWDERALTVAMAAIQHGLPAEGRIPGFVPFDDVVPTAADAPLIDRLVAWNGRRPPA